MCKALEDFYNDGVEEGKSIGKEEGRTEGKAEGKAESILDLLEEHEAVPEDLRKQILEQKDLVILRKWLKLASGVNNIQEFIQRM